MTALVSLDDLPRHAPRRRVICGSMFHNEIAALDWRLHELDGVVDDFVTVESIRTHSDKPRALRHPDRDPRYSDIRARFHNAILENPSGGTNPWVRERQQRVAVWTLGAAPLEPDDDAIVIISDTDEVPFPEVVEKLASSEFDTPLYVRPHWFNFNWNTYLGPWPHASIRFYTAGILRRLFAEGRGAEIGTCTVPGVEITGLNGWHASWFGSDQFVLDKLAAYAHASDAKDRQAMAEGTAGVQRRRSSGFDMFGIQQAKSPPDRLPAHAHRIPDPG